MAVWTGTTTDDNPGFLMRGQATVGYALPTLPDSSILTGGLGMTWFEAGAG